MTAVMLARRSVGPGALWLFGVGASAPLTVVGGAVVATFATTGVVGLPLAFVVLAVALLPLAVPYVVMARHVGHPAPFYGTLGRVSGMLGVAGGWVSLLAYNCIQISLYGLLGDTLATNFGGPWWVWAGTAFIVVASLGRLRLNLNGSVFAWLLIFELTVLVIFNLAAFLHPAGGHVSFEPLSPDTLLAGGAGVGGAFAFGVACFAGFETPAAYAEEARSPRAIALATFLGLGSLVVLYGVSSWALAVTVGPDRVADAAREDPGLVSSLLEDRFGTLGAGAAGLLLITSIVAAMLSFHNTAARTMFGMAREKVLPAGLAHIGVGTRGGAPTRASAVQSVTALLVLAGAVLFEVAPLSLFTWLGTIGGLAVLFLLVVTALAAKKYFAAGGGGHEGAFVVHLAPVGGFIAGVLVLFTAGANLDSLLGLPQGSPLGWLAPALIGAVALVGLLHGVAVRYGSPDTYRGITRGRPNPLAVPDPRLADLEV